MLDENTGHQRIFRRGKIAKWFFGTAAVVVSGLFIAGSIIHWPVDVEWVIFDAIIVFLFAVGGYYYFGTAVIVADDYVEYRSFRTVRIYFKNVEVFHKNRFVPWLKTKTRSMSFGSDLEAQSLILELIERRLKAIGRGGRVK